MKNVCMLLLLLSPTLFAQAQISRPFEVITDIEAPEFVIYMKNDKSRPATAAYADKITKIFAIAQRNGFLVAARIEQVEEFDILGEALLKKTERIIRPIAADERKGSDPELTFLVDLRQELNFLPRITRISIILQKIPQLNLISDPNFTRQDQSRENQKVSPDQQNAFLKLMRQNFLQVSRPIKFKCLNAFN